jgi:hypothetical protein
MKIRFSYWLRVIHRDLGFLVIGFSLVYGISGILLNHLGEKDPAFRTEEKSVSLPVRLTEKELAEEWSSKPDLPVLKKIIRIDETHSRLMLEGGIGVYNSADGHVDYEKYTKRPFIYWINRLHYNKVKGWNFAADFFAASLIFLAVSGLFMVKGKKGVTGLGKWYVIAGLLIPLLYVILS